MKTEEIIHEQELYLIVKNLNTQQGVSEKGNKFEKE